MSRWGVRILRGMGIYCARGSITYTIELICMRGGVHHVEKGSYAMGMSIPKMGT